MRIIYGTGQGDQMKFSTREDAQAPAEFVFAALSDFEGIERLLLQRGTEVQRLDSLPEKAPGMQWNVGFRFRGRGRKAHITLNDYVAPQKMRVSSVTGGLEAEMTIEVDPLPRDRARVKIGLDLKPKTLSARLLVQSMKLAKSKMDDRFKTSIAKYLHQVSQDYQKAA